MFICVHHESSALCSGSFCMQCKHTHTCTVHTHQICLYQLDLRLPQIHFVCCFASLWSFSQFHIASQLQFTIIKTLNTFLSFVFQPPSFPPLFLSIYGCFCWCIYLTYFIFLFSFFFYLSIRFWIGCLWLFSSFSSSSFSRYTDRSIFAMHSKHIWCHFIYSFNMGCWNGWCYLRVFDRPMLLLCGKYTLIMLLYFPILKLACILCDE